MSVSNYNFLWCCVVYFVFCVKSQDIEIISHVLDEGNILKNLGDGDLYFIREKILKDVNEKVDIKLYYECLCPDCRLFDSTQFKTVVQKLHQYLNIHTYPYGNAETIEKDGHYEFQCQHGPAECYGNKLHACALELIPDSTDALLFNSCLMDKSQEGHASDNTAADKCGKSMNVEVKVIKECANGQKGSELLKYYGDQSHKVNFSYVPYLLINGKPNEGEHFFDDVCAAFTNPPSPCVATTM